jgi:thymidylate synthase (FAD)
MGQHATPKAFLIAETRVERHAIEAALSHLGVTGWTTDAPDDASLLSEFAGKSCYMSFDKSLNANLTTTGGRNNLEYLQNGIIATKHGSVLEHSSVTFFFTNVSRVVTHELVRHRAGTAFSQTSGRYVRNPEVDMFLPSVIDNLEGGPEVFALAMNQMEENIATLVNLAGLNAPGVDFNYKKQMTSAFRRLIGNGQANHLVMTGNHRAWRHIIEVRTSVHAEEEIRVALGDVARQLKHKYPHIYADMHENEQGEFVFAASKV